MNSFTLEQINILLEALYDYKKVLYRAMQDSIKNSAAQTFDEIRASQFYKIIDRKREVTEELQDKLSLESIVE